MGISKSHPGLEEPIKAILSVGFLLARHPRSRSLLPELEPHFYVSGYVSCGNVFCFEGPVSSRTALKRSDLNTLKYYVHAQRIA